MTSTIIITLIAALIGFAIWYLKKPLEIKHQKQFFQFSKNFEKKTEVVNALIIKLDALNEAADDYTRQKNPDSKRDTFQEIYGRASTDFWDYFRLNNHYLPTDTNKLVEDYGKTLQNVFFYFEKGIEESKEKWRAEQAGASYKEYFAQADMAEKELKILRENFQKILGLET